MIALAKNSPILAGADQGCYVDIDDTIKATYGDATGGAGHEYTGVKASTRCSRSCPPDPPLTSQEFWLYVQSPDHPRILPWWIQAQASAGEPVATSVCGEGQLAKAASLGE